MHNFNYEYGGIIVTCLLIATLSSIFLAYLRGQTIFVLGAVFSFVTEIIYAKNIGLAEIMCQQSIEPNSSICTLAHDRGFNAFSLIKKW